MASISYQSEHPQSFQSEAASAQSSTSSQSQHTSASTSPRPLSPKAPYFIPNNATWPLNAEAAEFTPSSTPPSASSLNAEAPIFTPSSASTSRNSFSQQPAPISERESLFWDDDDESEIFDPKYVNYGCRPPCSPSSSDCLSLRSTEQFTEQSTEQSLELHSEAASPKQEEHPSDDLEEEMSTVLKLIFDVVSGAVPDIYTEDTEEQPLHERDRYTSAWASPNISPSPTLEYPDPYDASDERTTPPQTRPARMRNAEIFSLAERARLRHALRRQSQKDNNKSLQALAQEGAFGAIGGLLPSPSRSSRKPTSRRKSLSKQVWWSEGSKDVAWWGNSRRITC